MLPAELVISRAVQNLILRQLILLHGKKGKTLQVNEQVESVAEAIKFSKKTDCAKKIKTKLLDL